MTMTTTVLTESPSLGSLYVRAALPALPGADLVPALRKPVSDSLPDTRLELQGVGFDLGHVSRYREVCGFPQAAAIPPTYPHVLAFPLHLALMTAQEFPLAVLGAVHIENTIDQLRPLHPDDLFDLSVQATQLGPHPRGRTVTLLSEASVDGELVWRDVSVFLSRGRSSGERSGPVAEVPADAPAGPIRWSLDGGLGRRYAAVSGDRNPIHLSRVTAKAFGFPTQIAHGMWTKARVLAALAPRLPAAFAVTVSFRKPVRLPSTVSLGARGREGNIDFGLTSVSTGEPHLLGRLTRR